MDPSAAAEPSQIEAAMLARNIGAGLHRSFRLRAVGAYGPGQLRADQRPERDGLMIDLAIWEGEREPPGAPVRTGFAFAIAASDWTSRRCDCQGAGPTRGGRVSRAISNSGARIASP